MFWENFNRLCNEKGVTPNRAAKEIGIPSGSVTDWKNGRQPRSATVLRIADYFGVPSTALLDEPSPAPILEPQAIPGITAEEQEIILALRLHPEYVPILRKLLDLPAHDEKSVVS